MEFYGVEISYQQAWCAKERALQMLRGKPSYGYRQMLRYICMLNTVYPNSYIRMHKLENNEFISIVVVDSAHLGGAYKGTFVSVSTLDGAGMTFVILL
ncbi:hypothetical protein H5410_031331 [Solanum commersonii]|uniref:Uncharacterized protein n=1 Tax=Solanum commersonii TaxID=4109 RepID=A0A9J5YI41_SOLCO|nr:hypothetical protein H5410_031331 [Solanum commersonii]